MSDSNVSIMIDSGAFSAWRLKKPVDLKAYCDWLKRNESWISHYVVLDEIIPSDPEEAAKRSFENLLYMRKLGLDPIPVYHVKEDISWLKRMLDLGCSYIGLSGTSISSMAASDEYYEMAWSHLVTGSGEPLVQVHAFGEARESCMKKFPWTSTDASTWIDAQRYARFMMPDYTLEHKKNRASSKSSRDVEFIDGDELDALNLDLERYNVLKSALEDRASKTANVARSYLAAVKWVMIEKRVRDSLPIRFVPKSKGLFSIFDPPKKEIEFQERFNFYFGVGNNALTIPCLHQAGAKNFLISYFYIDRTEGGLHIQNYLKDPEAALHQKPYGQYQEILEQKVLIEKALFELS
jgi:hypothetical protein